jgi:hypothetical protein
MGAYRMLLLLIEDTDFPAALKEEMNARIAATAKKNPASLARTGFN